MRKVIALLLLLAFAVPASAEYVLGSDGYYWSNGIAYTRTRYWQPGYGYGCNAVAGYYFYQYTPATYTPATTVTYTPDWKDRLLKIAEKKKDYEAFLQSAREFGLTVPYAAGYGTFTAHGTTTYGYGAGYSFQTQQYTPVDLNLLYQQASQHVAGSQRLGAEATAGFQQLAAQAGLNQARAAEILARGQALAAVLALPPSQETRSFTFSIGPGGSLKADSSKVAPEDKAKLLENWKELAAAKCLPCHNSQKASGNFNIGLYPEMNPEQKQAVWQSLTNPDENKRMPRNVNGTPGTPLTAEQIRLFLLN